MRWPRCAALCCPATGRWSSATARPRAGTWAGARQDEGLVHLRQRYPCHLSRAPRQRPGGVPGGHRRPRAVRADREGRPRMQAVPRGRPRCDLPHRRLRLLRGLQARLYDQLPPARCARRTAGSATAATPTTCWPRRPRACGCPIRCPTWMARSWPAAFGTAYEALTRMNVSGADRLFITGLGPVGLAVAMLGRALGASTIIGRIRRKDACGWRRNWVLWITPWVRCGHAGEGEGLDRGRGAR